MYTIKICGSFNGFLKIYPFDTDVDLKLRISYKKNWTIMNEICYLWALNTFFMKMCELF